MALKITQETFNDAVRENIEDLGMEPAEAITEAVKQFESQGADLSNIIKEPLTENSRNDIRNIISDLTMLVVQKKPEEEVQGKLTELSDECGKSIAHQVTAGEEGAYKALINILDNPNTSTKVMEDTLKTMVVLMNKQPDLLDDEGAKIMINILCKPNQQFNIEKLALRWAKICCIMHEMNRQKLMELNIVDHIKVKVHDAGPENLREILALMRALILDDDVRVEFGKHHDHARIIATELLCLLTPLLTSYKNEELVISDLMLTLSTLMVRTEYCKKVEDAGGLNFIYNVFKAFTRSEKVNRQCFKFLKALTGNDEVKRNIISKYGLAPVIVEALQTHMTNGPTAHAGLQCIAALSLRCPDNSKALFDAGAPEVIVNAMIKHSNDATVQKSGAWAIRNMVSRSRYQCKDFLKAGAEDALQEALKKYKNCEYDIKAALRDLECDVKLTEEWTGKGGALTTGKVLQEDA